jgi:Alkylmercury lyase
VDDADLALRNDTYRLFVALGCAPAAEEVAASAGLSASAVRAGWQRLHDAHALVLERDGAELRMLNPFSAVPTPHRVLANSRWWYANCAWDALGICAALHVNGKIETSCPDCAEPITVRVRAKQPDNTRLLFHCLMPAASWWDDIVFT